MTPVWILVACVAVIGLAVVLYKRLSPRGAKSEEATASARQ